MILHQTTNVLRDALWSPNIKVTALACSLVALGAISAGEVFNWLYRDSLKQLSTHLWEENQGVQGIAAGLLRNPDIPRDQIGNLFMVRARAWLPEYHPDVTLVDGNMKPLRDNGAVWLVSYRLKDGQRVISVQKCFGDGGENVDCRCWHQGWSYMLQ